MYPRLSFLLFLFFLLSCQPKVLSNFGVEKWSGYDLNYKKINFQEIDTKGLILNFYSPFCEPCIRELPALELLYSLAKSRGLAMFLALPSQLILGNDEIAKEKEERRLDFKERHKSIARIIRKDIYSYSISIPFVITSETFRIGPQELVKATPETLFFRTKPLVLEYNFIGPLSYAKTKKELLKDSRFRFALERIEEIEN